MGSEKRHFVSTTLADYATDKKGGAAYYEDGRNYDAMQTAKAIYYQNPQKYEAERKNFTYSQQSYGTSHRTTRNTYSGRVDVVVEHWTGCTNQGVADDIRMAVEDNFRDVKFTEFIGRIDSFEVFVNGKLLYSRVMQGGYPYEEEVLEAVWRAKHGKEIYQVDRFGGSSSCHVL
ncbi:MIEN1-like protein [Mya arenaria]|uniref:MIEN1-like protein n=1 Tax=Mya arenaria TaxID=6604 RepID=A0ABY7G217_MYAAR|nr:uncharacterized protein LOC128220398 [Mya arenaria]WAR27342.1 MIEN1-like protein [Mya arenaria]